MNPVPVVCGNPVTGIETDSRIALERQMQRNIGLALR